jgi:hypothetical protein
MGIGVDDKTEVHLPGHHQRPGTGHARQALTAFATRALDPTGCAGL